MFVANMTTLIYGGFQPTVLFPGPYPLPILSNCFMKSEYIFGFQFYGPMRERERER